MCSNPGGGTSQYNDGFLRLDLVFGDLERLRLRSSRLLERCLLRSRRSLSLDRRRLSRPLSPSRSIKFNNLSNSLGL